MTTLTRAGKSVGSYETSLQKSLVHLLSSTEIDAILDVPTVHRLYLVPEGKQAVIISVMARSNSASLAGMTDVNFGGGVAAITPVWKDAANFAGMTLVNSLQNMTISGAGGILDGDDSTEANRVFNAEVVAGSTVPANVTFDVFGYLIDS